MGVELDRIRKVVNEIVEAEAYELVDVELKGAGRQRVLRIFIDKMDEDDGGITHRDCELISEQVGTVLDVEDLIPFSYTLEVSSPGLDRKLLKTSDFTRFRGRLAKIQTKLPLNNQKTFRGRLGGLEGEKILLELPEGERMEIPLDVVSEARLEVDWESEKTRDRKK